MTPQDFYKGAKALVERAEAAESALRDLKRQHDELVTENAQLREMVAHKASDLVDRIRDDERILLALQTLSTLGDGLKAMVEARKG